MGFWYNIYDDFFPTSQSKIPIKERTDPNKERTGPTKFSDNWTLTIPEKCRLAMQDILLSSSLLTKPHREGSVIKTKPLRTPMGAECQGGPWPNHRNEHLSPEKQDEIFLDKWPDPQSTSHLTGMPCTIHCTVTQRQVWPSYIFGVIIHLWYLGLEEEKLWALQHHPSLDFRTM